MDVVARGSEKSNAAMPMGTAGFTRQGHPGPMRATSPVLAAAHG